MTLSQQDLVKLKDAFNTWAKTTPHPHRPAITLLNGGRYSPRKIAKGVAKVVDGKDPDNKIGKHVIALVDNYVSSGEATLDEVIADFTAPQPPTP